MELKILNSILYKELMPWTFDVKGISSINEKIKKIGSIEPTTQAELVQQLQTLLGDYPDLLKWLLSQNTNGTTSLKNLCFSIDFTAYSDAVSKFYNAVISLETLRVYNAFNIKMQKYTNPVDIVYQTTIALKNIKALTINTVKEIKERGFEEAPTEQSSLTHFVLHLLRQHLTVLFFDIQELSKASIDNPTSIEDFYLLDLNLPKSAIAEFHYFQPTTKKPEKKIINEKLTFGCKMPKPFKEKLKIAINCLCDEIDLLDENISPADELLDLLLSKDVISSKKKIKINCDNKSFRYVIESLMPFFENLSFINIERSKSFYSKRGTKPITSNDISKAKSFDPKEKEKIDKIFNKLK